MPDDLVTPLAVAAAVAVAGGAGCVLALHALPTGYSPLRDAVSDYGVGRYAWLYRAQVVLYGAGALLLHFALSHEGGVATDGLVWLLVFALARIAIAGFPTDLPRHGARPTRTGRIHLLLAAAAFTSIAFAAPGVSGSLHFARTLGHLVSAAAIATVVAAVVARTTIFGLVERLLYLAMTAWLLATAIHLA